MMAALVLAIVTFVVGLILGRRTAPRQKVRPAALAHAADDKVAEAEEESAEVKEALKVEQAKIDSADLEELAAMVNDL